jgi:hypothetical protein
MTTSRYKDLVVILLAAIIVMLVISRCNNDHKHAAQVTEYDNLVADLEADRLLILDSVDVLNEQLQIEREALPKRLNEYSQLPTKERIKLITKVDTLVVITDTSACLSIAGVDSVNKLTIHYQSCMFQSAIKDSINKALLGVISNDSTQKETIKIEFEYYKKKEASRNKKTYWRGFKHGSGVTTGLFAVIRALF